MNSGPAWQRLLTAAPRTPSGAQAPVDLLDEAVTLGPDTAEGVVACSITVKTVDGWETPHASAAVAIELDRAQYLAAAGPCVDAADTARVIRLTPITRAPLPYATFVAAAVERSILASLSVPVPGLPSPTALNLYAVATDAFDGSRPQQVAELLARLCGRLLGGAEPSGRPTGPAGEAPPDPADEMAARREAATVDRALRVVQQRQGVSRVQAHRWLMQQSLTRELSLADVAHEVAGTNEREPLS